jgi:(p)ppGpp synthase/HD superfamily hydrolase
MPTRLTSSFQDAVALAIQLHAEQTRKGTDIPYISHLLAVTAIVLEHGGNEEEAIAALLHDAVEDAGGSATRARIAGGVTKNVMAIIDGCTDDSPAAGHPKKPWRKRKKAYIAHIAKVSPSVLLVSAADKLHNARAIAADYSDLGEELWSRFNASRDDILWYYRALLEAFDGRLIALQEAEPEESDRYDDLYRLLNRLEETIEEINLEVEISKTAALMEAEFGLLADDDTTLFESLTDVTRPGLT